MKGRGGGGGEGGYCALYSFNIFMQYYSTMSSYVHNYKNIYFFPIAKYYHSILMSKADLQKMNHTLVFSNSMLKVNSVVKQFLFFILLSFLLVLFTFAIVGCSDI